jgi:hypothetical protein
MKNYLGSSLGRSWAAPLVLATSLLAACSSSPPDRAPPADDPATGGRAATGGNAPGAGGSGGAPPVTAADGGGALGGSGGADGSAGPADTAPPDVAIDSGKVDGGGGTGGAGPSDALAEPDATVPYPTPIDSLPAQLGACPTFADGVSTGVVKAPKLTELSGIVESRRTPGLLWAHNDAGNKARLYGVMKTGVLAAMLDVPVANALDIEDIAVGPGPVAGQPYLYIGDIGDNEEKRPSLAIYRAQEPTFTVSPTPLGGALTGIETLTLVYPDGTHNAETLLIDPITGDLFLVTKSSEGESHLFRAAAPLSSTKPNQLQDTGVVLRFGSAPLIGEPRTTGGDISPGGDRIIVRTYDHAFLWRRIAGQTVAQAMAGTACPIALHEEMHGEALGFAADGSGYYSASEGEAQPIYWYAATPAR